MQIYSSYSYDTTRFPKEQSHSEIIVENAQEAKALQESMAEQVQTLQQLSKQVDEGVERMSSVTKAPMNLGTFLDIYV